jgi:hypothetical protein
LFERAAIVSSVLLAVALGVCTFVLALPSGLGPQGVVAWVERMGEARTWVWGLLLGALSTVIVFGMMYLIVMPWSRRSRSPETKAALRAVTIRNFDWETTTLEFADDDYAERFAQANTAALF